MNFCLYIINTGFIQGTKNGNSLGIVHEFTRCVKIRKSITYFSQPPWRSLSWQIFIANEYFSPYNTGSGGLVIGA